MGSIDCPFCTQNQEDIVLQDALWYAMWDNYPVNEGHLLIISQRHISSYFDTTDKEKFSLLTMIERSKVLLDEQYHPDGYNVGINIGKAAGQTVMHLHIHIIPRYFGDISIPNGGIRGVIPSKRIYQNKSG